MEEAAPAAEAGDAEIENTGDVVLNVIVHVAEKGALMPMTVYTSGLAFTGFIASRRAYYEASMPLAGVAKSLYEEFLKLLPEADSEDDADDEDDGAPVPDYEYVHMIEAQVISPGTNGMPAGGVPIKLKRSEIVGWSHGKLMAS